MGSLDHESGIGHRGRRTRFAALVTDGEKQDGARQETLADEEERVLQLATQIHDRLFV
jgi:hypothetical protein